MSLTKNLAIQKALENNWEEAARLNEDLLVENPKDIETLNRLGFAYIKLGKLKKAKEMYKTVLTFDKTNPIALKNLKKINSLSQTDYENSIASKTTPSIRLDEIFIEEAGKTKIVELKNITDKVTLSILQPGDIIHLVIKRSRIFAQTESKKYVGMIPDNIGMRLIPFIQGGNTYLGFIKSVDEKSVIIFVKETNRAKRFKNQPSFTTFGVANQSIADLDLK